MKRLNSFKSEIINSGNGNFEKLALNLFRIQAKENKIYRRYLSALGVRAEKIDRIRDIPFLPIRFFKEHRVTTGDFREEAVFRSSGTGGYGTSRHYIESLSYYESVTEKIFERFYGDPAQYCMIGLLPSYLERKDSSLVHMVRHYIRLSRSSSSGFYLDDFEGLAKKLKDLRMSGRKVWLIGVTFALLEFSLRHGMAFDDMVLVETGGMKGRGRELIREELHRLLKFRMPGASVHSEYGMTELHSQAYMRDGEWFEAPPWMRVFIRDINDPFSYVTPGKNGAINIIDLANLYSCAFIETQDVGVANSAGRFKVLGRLDNTEQRGCNLMLF